MKTTEFLEKQLMEMEGCRLTAYRDAAGVPITISCSKLLKRLKQSQGHWLYSICTEAETLLKSNGSGAWAQKWDIYRNAFGRECWGVDFNSDQSESGDVRVAYNWTILGTPYTIISRWKAEGWIEKVGKSYRKLNTKN